MSFQESMEVFEKAIEAVGVLAIVVGIVVASVLALRALLQHRDRGKTYELFRQRLGRSILLGLELLVAADIIHTVAITPTFTSVGVLALIVVVRTFLSWSLEMEISGHWPWRKAQDEAAPERTG
ncbi:DUF1622 domain-containing protein [Kocuria sp. M1N1S27]|uniref:DUF1622 domain-containing protein n=1 Tax=Kocuria kalidii TaxID=3376283 RepID=UPI0037AE06D5